MKPLEVVIFIILLLMGVPDLCRLFRRPAMIYPCYVIIGMLLGGFFSATATSLLHQVGQFGFILLLFLIGLEIDLPPKHESAIALRRAALWMAAQFPFLLLIGWLLHGTMGETALAASALCGCSVGMAFAAWQHFPHRSAEVKRQLLLWMVGLEVLTIFLITGADIGMADGISWWGLLRLCGTAMAFLLVALFADHLTRQLSLLLSFTTRWRVHFIVLLVFTVAAIGERLGLSAPKTAFCLGLFVSRATHQGLQLEDHLRPIGEKLLIPIFFVGLGSILSPGALFGWTGLWAILTAGFLLGFREIFYRRVLTRSLDGAGTERRFHPRTFLMACPNLTMAGVAAETLREAGADGALLTWLLLSSLLISVASVLLLPNAAPSGLPEPADAAFASNPLPAPSTPWNRAP